MKFGSSFAEVKKNFPTISCTGDHPPCWVHKDFTDNSLSYTAHLGFVDGSFESVAMTWPAEAVEGGHIPLFLQLERSFEAKFGKKPDAFGDDNYGPWVSWRFPHVTVTLSAYGSSGDTFDYCVADILTNRASQAQRAEQKVGRANF